VREQTRIAQGERLGIRQQDVPFDGHAIECRINAEHPQTFVPSPGRVTQFHTPGGPGVRMDSAVFAGYTIPPYYDSMIGKLIVHAEDRPTAILRMRRALRELVVDGVQTTIPLHLKILDDPAFRAGDYHIHWLEQRLAAAEA
jgi:acetyl-CoA carboxylase biotin carboxylase subunit